MGIIVAGAAFVDIKGFPDGAYIPTGRNVGQVKYIHGGVARNVVEDIANMELRPIYLGIVDDTPLGNDVVEKLKKHKVNTAVGSFRAQRRRNLRPGRCGCHPVRHAQGSGKEAAGSG